MRPKKQPRGFTGPRSVFWECHGPDVIAPKAWGSKRGDQARQDLLDQQYHTRECAPSSDVDESPSREDEDSPAIGEFVDLQEGEGIVKPAVPDVAVPDAALPDGVTDGDSSKMWIMVFGALGAGLVLLKMKTISDGKKSEQRKEEANKGMAEARRRQIERFEQEAKERAGDASWKEIEKQRLAREEAEAKAEAKAATQSSATS